jgi:hypothetical protein
MKKCVSQKCMCDKTLCGYIYWNCCRPSDQECVKGEEDAYCGNSGDQCAVCTIHEQCDYGAQKCVAWP